MTGVNPASIKSAVLWVLGDVLFLVFISGIAITAVALMQQRESSTNGFLDKVTLALLFVTAALVSRLVDVDLGLAGNFKNNPDVVGPNPTSITKLSNKASFLQTILISSFLSHHVPVLLNFVAFAKRSSLR